MKKIIYLLMLVLMLSFSAVCSASNGSLLDAEDAIVNKFITATNYKVLEPLMTNNLKKDFPLETFNNYQEQLEKNFGKLLEHQFFALQKYPDGDQVRYFCAFEKEPEAQYIFLFVFEKGKPLLEKFALTLPPKEEAAQDNAADAAEK